MRGKLKAYAYKDNNEGIVIEIIYHSTAKEAKKLGVSKAGYSGDFVDVSCTRFPDADKYAEKHDYPCIENDSKVLRRLGWGYEGEHQCASCGLHPMGITEFELCVDCEHCPECGCDNDCANKSPA